MKTLQESASIVLLGRFSPRAFMPERLAEGKVISKKTASSAVWTLLIPDQHLEYTLEWASIQVSRDRFQITAREPPVVQICDFVVTAFNEVAVPGSLGGLGINYEATYEFDSYEARDRLGVRLAPPSAWGPWGGEISASMSDSRMGTTLQGGMIELKMRLPFREGEISGWREISVTPAAIPNSLICARFYCNHHHEIDRETGSATFDAPASTHSESVTILLRRLQDTFERSISDSRTIISGVMTE